MALKSHTRVLNWQLFADPLSTLLKQYDLYVATVPADEQITGSFWGDNEAGLVGNQLYLRTDTPLHSALHEACHYICMDPIRRLALDTNAGGDTLEECAVCYLQIILGEQIPGVSRQQLFNDMDSWGYSFRLGSTEAWFNNDAEDAVAWLQHHNVLDGDRSPTGQLRT